MKKWFASILVLAVFCAGCFFTYQYFYGGSTFYTRIQTEGEKAGAGEDRHFIYQQLAYDDQGDAISVKLIEYRDQQLRQGAYLKLLVNPRKSVISWTEVVADDVPEKALTHLE